MKNTTTNLKSSVNKMGKLVTQIIQFSGGNTKTWQNMKPETMIEGRFVKMWCSDGKMVMIHTKNVDWIEVHSQELEIENQKNDKNDLTK